MAIGFSHFHFIFNAWDIFNVIIRVLLLILFILVVNLSGGNTVLQRQKDFETWEVVSPATLETRNLRSTVECATSCMEVPTCGGFTFDPVISCELYGKDDIVASNTSSGKMIFKFSERKCGHYPNFEEMTIEGTSLCVRVYTDLMTSEEEAAKLCAQQETTLVALKTKAIIDGFRDILVNRGEYDASPGYWIGLSDREEENTFVWDLDGEVIGDTHEVWRAHQPNGGTTQNCTALIGNYPYLFQDKECTNSYRVVCQARIGLVTG